LCPYATLFRSLRIALERQPLLVSEIFAVSLFHLAEQRVDPGLRVSRGRDVGRVEVEVEADRAAVLGAEARKLAQHRQRHRSSHRRPVPTMTAAIVCIRSPAAQGTPGAAPPLP